MADLLKPLLRRIAFAPFNPLSLFANGEQGVWFDPSDLTTLFQDSAGTTPVTADGDPVGLMLDKSGNGNHASQATTGSKPIYRTDGTLHWLEFSSSKVLAVSAEVITGTNWFMSCGCFTGVDEWLSPFVVIGANGSSSSALYSDTRATPRRLAGFGEVSDREYVDRPTKLEAGVSEVLSATRGSTSGAGYINNTTEVTTTLAAQTGDLSDLRLGNYTVIWAEGGLYGAIVLDRQVSSDEQLNTESYLAKKAGVTL